MLCVLIPFRDRHAHLARFLPNLRRFLAAQKIPARLVVVEQAAGQPFNRGRLINAGFDHTRGRAEVYCFHDVDLIPLVSDYRPGPHPTHLATHTEQFGWRLPYPSYFGGVTLFPADAFRRVGGFPNDFWGWGGEDDALLRRCERAGVAVYRRAGVYRSLPHSRVVDPKLYRENVAKLDRLNNAPHAEERAGLADLRYRVVDSRTGGDLDHVVIDF
jgi:beta-1,4-galactosyltransferase 2